MKKRRVLFLIVLSIAFSIIMCSCGGGGDDGINIDGIWFVTTSITNSTCGVAPETGYYLWTSIEQDGANVTWWIGPYNCFDTDYFHGTLSGESLQVSTSGPGNYAASINATVINNDTISGTFSESGVDCSSFSFISKGGCCESPESSDCIYEGTLSAGRPKIDPPPPFLMNASNRNL